MVTAPNTDAPPLWGGEVLRAAAQLARRNSPQGINIATRAFGDRSQREETDGIGDSYFIYCARTGPRYRARYYDPGWGRFVSEDPIGFASGDWNSYTAMRDSPLVFSDPLGLYSVEELANIIYNETSSLKGPEIFAARIALGSVAANREKKGIDGGVSSTVLNEIERRAILNRVPLAVYSYTQSLIAASGIINGCYPDPTGGALEYNIRGNAGLHPPSLSGTPVLLHFGPITNTNPTIGNPRVPLREQLPSIVYINIYGVSR